MSRTRSKPWLHRFSRPLIGAIATAGAINTAYLTYLHFTSQTCPTQTCAVLASRYATVFGQPLSLFGLLAYIAMAGLALSPLLVNPETQKALRKNLEDKTWLLLFAGATAMFVFSLYLMNVMFSEFVFGGRSLGLGGVCPFCLFSAVLALGMFILTIVGREWDEIGPLFSIGAVAALVTLVSSLGIYAQEEISANAGTVTDGSGKVVYTYNTESGEAETELAKHLKSTGAVMYGAYWCTHCCTQKLLFGKEAVKQELPYTECAEDGQDPQVDTCQQAFTEAEKQTGQRAGFPTWQVNGKYLVGPQPLTTLAAASDYKGPSNFQNAGGTCQAQ